MVEVSQLVVHSRKLRWILHILMHILLTEGSSHLTDTFVPSNQIRRIAITDLTYFLFFL